MSVIPEYILVTIIVSIALKILFAIAMTSSSIKNDLQLLPFLRQQTRIIDNSNQITPQMRITACGLMLIVDIIVLSMYVPEYRRLNSTENVQHKKLLDATLWLIIVAIACSVLFFLCLVFVLEKDKFPRIVPYVSKLSACVLFLSAGVSSAEYTLLHLCNNGSSELISENYFSINP